MSSAYTRPCRYCTAVVLLTRLYTGHWRAFDPDPVEAEPGLYRHRRGAGMVEAPGVPGYRLHVPGYRLHVCVEQSLARYAITEVLDELRPH